MYPDTIFDILVFKTNISTEQDIQQIARVLNNDSRIQRWNVDNGDVDCVLRIQTDCLTCNTVIELIQHAGYTCEELPD